MNRAVGSVALVSKTCIRTLSTTGMRRAIKPDMTNIKKKQMQFQVDNDVPVFLKGGPMDQVLHIGTWVLTLCGLGISFQALYKLSKS